MRHRLDARPPRAIRAPIVGLLVLAVILIQLPIEDDLGALLLIPVCLAGVWFGRWAGTSVGVGGVGLLVAFQQLEPLGVVTAQPVPTIARLLAFASAGHLVGWLTEERRHARTAAAQQRAILRSALDGVITMDHQGRVLDFNPRAEQTFGYTKTDILGQELARFIVPPRDREKHREALARYLRTGESRILDRRVELQALCSDGSEIPVELTVTWVERSSPPVFVGSIRDLTPTKESAKKVAELLERERRARITAERAQQQSRQLAAEAMNAEQAERRRISEVLHDDAVQTLLAASQDLTEAQQGEPQSLNRAADAVRETVRRLREAVFELHPVALQRAGLDAALRALAERQGRIGGYQTRVQVIAEGAGPHDDLVLAIIRELLTNVTKHAQAHEVRVSVVRSESSALVQVADDGRGITAGRLDVALREGHIGLASTTQRVEALGGKLDIISEPKRGTVIRATLPLHKHPAPA